MEEKKKINHVFSTPLIQPQSHGMPLSDIPCLNNSLSQLIEINSQEEIKTHSHLRL